MADSVQIQTHCCIVGGGPSGIMLGFLLARAGIPVVVLEKHADFFRDFRGDTIHPSTLELIHELGLLDEFLKLPHQEYRELILKFDGHTVKGPNFDGLPTKCKFIAFAPQWDFLNFLADQGRKYSTFDLHMNTAATGLIEENGHTVGVVASSPQGEVQIRADLVVGADGRGSILRQQSGLKLDEFGVPIDVLWYRLPKTASDEEGHALGRIQSGKMMITIDRGDYYQCATVIRKGQTEAVKSEGLELFRQNIVELAPFLKDSVHELQDWDQVKLLTVQMNRLRKWYRPGLLFIGDAAHAMSPAGGVGVNIAVQDAVATANLLAENLRSRTCTEEDLKRVQDRREWPAKKTQKLQTFVHHRLFDSPKGFGQTSLFSAPGRAVLSLGAPLVRRVLARVIGIGFLPEHIETPEVKT